MVGLILKLNTAIESEKELMGKASFVYQSISGRVKLYVRNNCVLMFSQGLADALGFYANTAYNETTLAQFIAYINRGFNSLYVNCSICEPQIVGDAYVPLIRTVYISQEIKVTQSTTFMTLLITYQSTQIH